MTFFLMPVTATYATSNAAPGDWITMGGTNGPAPDYSLYYYKLMQVNADSNRYSGIYEVNISADANYFNMQGTYRIRVDKFEKTPGRFDGLEIKCISGNPGAATFYVYNNALWVRANFQWGLVTYRTVGEFGQGTPLNSYPYNQTTTTPTGYLTTTASSGVKCDFDNNKFYPLSYEDVYGNVTVSGKLGAGTVPAYALHTAARGNTGGAAAYLWGEYYGVGIGTQNGSASTYSFTVINNAAADATATVPGGTTPLFCVRGDGNVGIGTFVPQAKLAVNGDLVAKKVRVTQAGWADFVFHPDYQLPGLQQVEEYITLHRHLPDIPAAAEVEKEGLDVAEMSKKMMQKIEELTLYIILQDKKINELTKEVKAQAKGNAQL
ncbi:hypothetical protein [Chitinophaga sp. 212800010-3]